MMKKRENRYGVKIGDIFNRQSRDADGEIYSFYQVVDFRGRMQVVVRRIESVVIAFDRYNDGVVPLPDTFFGQIFARGVVYVEDSDSLCIKIYGDWAFMERKEMYIRFAGPRPCFGDILKESLPEIADQFCLKEGSGIFAIDKPFDTFDGDYRAILRYPDGREQEIRLKDKKIIF